MRLRARAGRREFVQSTGAHDYSVGKLVGSAYLAAWRRQLHEWERGRVDNQNLLKLVEGGTALGETSYVTVGDASAATGLDRSALLRLVADGKLELFCPLGVGDRGHVLDKDLLEVTDAALGTRGGLVVPDPAQMPDAAQEAAFPGQTLRIMHCRELAQEALSGGLEVVDVVLLDAPSPAGWCFAPDKVLQLAIDGLVLSTAQLEPIRMKLAARVPPERLEFARAERSAALAAQLARDQAALLACAVSSESITGKWARKKFSEAVDGYCKSPDGLPSTLTSAIDQRQRRAGLLLFAEFMGDQQLSQIEGDTLRRFRDGPLKTIPGRVNTLPKAIRRDTMTATIAALNADGREWPLLSEEMRRERMQWLFRLFGWLLSKEYISRDPSASLRNETGLTKAERKAARRSGDDEDEDGRDPFTDEQLRLIFEQPHYKTGHGRHVKKPGYWYGFEYWLPLLGLYSGLRIKEASQLHLSDVREQDGVWCLDINERTPDKSLKNPQSTRLVPLHPELVRLGFVDYCDRLHAEGFRRVFPELTWSTTNAKYAKESGRKMSAMLEDLGMARDGKLVYHCLRHNANNAMLRVPLTVIAGVDEHLKRFIRHRVLGHEVGKDANIKHYTDARIAEMHQLVAGVQHNLPVIKALDIEFSVQQIRVALGKKKGTRKDREDMGLVDCSPGRRGLS